MRDRNDCVGSACLMAGGTSYNYLLSLEHNVIINWEEDTLYVHLMHIPTTKKGVPFATIYI